MNSPLEHTDDARRHRRRQGRPSPRYHRAVGRLWIERAERPLPDGSRAELALGEAVTPRGPAFTIRKYAEEPFTPVDLIEYGTFSVEQMAHLWLAIEHNRSLLFAGGTASDDQHERDFDVHPAPSEGADDRGYPRTATLPRQLALLGHARTTTRARTQAGDGRVHGRRLRLLPRLPVYHYGAGSVPAGEPPGGSRRSNSGGAAIDGLGGFDSDGVGAFETVFYHATLVQGSLSGLIAGQLSAGDVRAGAKHAAVMIALSALLFTVVV